MSVSVGNVFMLTVVFSDIITIPNSLYTVFCETWFPVIAVCIVCVCVCVCF